MYGDANKESEIKKVTTKTPVVTNSNYRSQVDTTPIASPFGKSTPTTAATTATTTTTTPTTGPSFAKFSIEAEEELLPKYMQSKMVVKDDSKYQTALSNKKELEVKPRPLHLQYDLNNNIGVTQNQNVSLPQFNQTSQIQTNPQPQANPFFGSNQDHPQANPFFQPQQQEPQFFLPPSKPFQQTSNPFF